MPAPVSSVSAVFPPLPKFQSLEEGPGFEDGFFSPPCSLISSLDDGGLDSMPPAGVWSASTSMDAGGPRRSDRDPSSGTSSPRSAPPSVSSSSSEAAPGSPREEPPAPPPTAPSPPPPMRRGRRMSLPTPGDFPALRPLTSSRPSSPSPPPAVARRSTARQVPMPAHADPPAACSCDLKVMVADDSPLNQKWAGRVFARFCSNAKVDVVPHGQAALDAFARASSEDPYHVLVLDLEMPEMTGLEAARAVRKAERSLRQRAPARLLAWSTLVGEAAGQREECEAAGFDAALSKPCSPPALLSHALAGLPHGPGCPYRTRRSALSIDPDALAAALASASSAPL